MKTISIIGTAGIPANYGGFESLVENLVIYRSQHEIDVQLFVFCSSKNHKEKIDAYLGAKLKYVNISANGIFSIAYDIYSIAYATICRHQTILILGVSGTIILPLIRIFGQSRIITNVDGVEWKRGKWGLMARLFLRLSEYCAVKFSHEVISDNEAIASHLLASYGTRSNVIAYGGDHALSMPSNSNISFKLPTNYALSICRIEPENNPEIILHAISQSSSLSLVFVGNWNGSNFGKRLRDRYSGYSNLLLLDPIYDLGKLRYLREGAAMYIHGHSAGGTNPSLVEMMHFGIPILAYDCDFNRFTTENSAFYFQCPSQILDICSSVTAEDFHRSSASMRRIAKQRYTWEEIGSAYFELLDQSRSLA